MTSPSRQIIVGADQFGHSSESRQSLQGRPYRLNDLKQPISQVTWEIDSLRCALLIHDMQQYFVGALPKHPRNELVSNNRKLLQWAREREIPVIYTAQPGSMTPQQRGLLFDFWGAGMSATPKERSIIAELTPKEDEAQLTKWRYSAFYGSSLRDQLRQNVRDQLIITGIFASIGVQSTAIEAYTQDIQTFVPQDAVADFSERDHADAMAYLARTCACVTTTNEVISGARPA